MGVYCSVAFARSYCEDSGVALPAQDAEVERLIARGQRDVDGLIGPHLRDPTTGLKLDPVTLSVAQASALARATAAAVEWRVAQGEENLLGIDDGTTNIAVAGLTMGLGPGPRPPGPKVAEELRGYGLMLTQLCASPDA